MLFLGCHRALGTAKLLAVEAAGMQAGRVL